jgi:hypothetical protein
MEIFSEYLLWLDDLDIEDSIAEVEDIILVLTVKETEEKEKMEGIHSGTSSNSSKPSSQP